MKRKDLVDTLEIIKNTCHNRNENCDGCPFFSSTADCLIIDKTPEDWNINDLANNLFPTITHDEYIILKNFSEKYEKYYIARSSNKYDNDLHLYITKPQKYENGYWASNIYIESPLSAFNHIFKTIKWEDEEPRKIIDLIKEYEEVHGICS